MSERHWPRPALATTALALLGAGAVAGCSNSASTSQAGATQSAAVAAAAGQGFTAAEVKDALLTDVNGDKPAAAAEFGNYGTLPDVQTSKQTMTGVKVDPAKCAQVSVTGFNSASFADAPAAVVTFRVGNNGVSEVLVAASSSLATTALGNKLPVGCAHYDATGDGKTFRYSVKEASLSGIGDQARAMNVKAVGYSAVDVWSVVFGGDGFVGAVTLVGPDASKSGVRTLAENAYANASQSLSRV